MPEVVETVRAADKLIAALQEGGKWMYFVNAFKIGGRMNAEPTSLIPALDQPIVDLFTKGKYYFIRLANWITIKAHCGMIGHWDFNYPPNLANTHFRLDFHTTSDYYMPCRTLYFVNGRFGSFEILTSEMQLKVALDQLADGFIGRFILDKNNWCGRITTISKTKLVRDVLLDQKMLCSGIGNYLVAEIMYYARLHPLITFGQLQTIELYQLYDVCLQVVKGHYELTLEKVIYGRSQCPCGHQIQTLESKDRKAWFCPVEQPLRP